MKYHIDELHWRSNWCLSKRSQLFVILQLFCHRRWGRPDISFLIFSLTRWGWPWPPPLSSWLGNLQHSITWSIYHIIILTCFLLSSIDIMIILVRRQYAESWRKMQELRAQIQVNPYLRVNSCCSQSLSPFVHYCSDIYHFQEHWLL